MVQAPAAAGRSDAEFYVGSLRMPPGLARVLWRAVPGVLVVAAALAWLVARAQNDPGGAVWNSGVAREFAGRVEATPYPHLRVLTGRPDEPVETLLLVEVGKFGGGQRAAALSGQTARISGWILERDGRRMLEMEPGDTLKALGAAAPGASQSAADVARLSTPRVTSLGRVTLRGEIIDSKCYLGAMKPGEGKTHKECATLCIAGGIPPMFVTTDLSGRRGYYLLTDAAGRALEGAVLRDSVLPLVADAVEITGMLEKHDDLYVLKVDPASIRRL
jgi:hypothetical protein